MEMGALWIVVFLASVLVYLPMAGVILLGALKMRKLELYGLAVLASILAMLPCHAGFVIGFPVGIWSLIVLMKPEVKAAFRGKGQNGQSMISPQRSSSSGCLIAAVLLTCLVTFCVLAVGALAILKWRSYASSGARPTEAARRQQEAERAIASQRASEYRGWEFGQEGPQLTDRAARSLKLLPQQHEQVNQVLQTIVQEYLKLEERYTERTTNDAGHQITSVAVDGTELAKLEDRLWTQLDAILNLVQQRAARSALKFYPLEPRPRVSPLSELATPGLLGWGDLRATIEIWRVGSWFHWRVTTTLPLGGGIAGHVASQGPELPEQYRRFWKEPS